MIIIIEDDFDLRKIADSGQCFRVKEFDNSMFRFITRDQVLYIRPLEANQYEINCSKETWETSWYPYFHLDRSYREVRNRIGVRDKYSDPFCQDSFLINLSLGGKRTFL